jgi:NAD(P)-dependent dehydrogenase (short-subunit alcohol dehydrogenase family)
VSVNAICPGIVATDLLRGLLGHRQAELTAGITLGRVGTPEAVWLQAKRHPFVQLVSKG